MKILILGAGAVGGYFGTLLQDQGVDVTFLVREKRAIQLKKNGLNVISQLGDVAVQPQVITNVTASDKFDLAIISCKAYALEGALKSLTQLHASAYILPLLNGISHYSRLREFFGRERVLGGFAHLSTALDENGNIVHLNRLQVLKMGALEVSQKKFIQHCRNILSPVAPFIDFPDDIGREIWQKLIFISTAAGGTCLMKKPMGAIVSDPAGAQVITESFELNCKAANFAGYGPDPEWKDITLKDLLNRESQMTSSLFRDMQNGNRAELSVLEDMLYKNRAAGLNNKLLESALLILQRYESERSNAG